jgi:hypothetical protein
MMMTMIIIMTIISIIINLIWNSSVGLAPQVFVAIYKPFI